MHVNMYHTALDQLDRPCFDVMTFRPVTIVHLILELNAIPLVKHGAGTLARKPIEISTTRVFSG